MSTMMVYLRINIYWLKFLSIYSMHIKTKLFITVSFVILSDASEKEKEMCTTYNY